MALKPTIYKFEINLSDTNRNDYRVLNLTIAQHPSETLERMMARVLAFCLNTEDELGFTKGLSEPDVPDIRAHTLDGQLSVWIDVGEPAVERIKKATRIAKQVKVYSFNSKSGVWWEQAKTDFSKLPVSVFRLHWPSIKTLAALVERTMQLSVTISEDSIFVAMEKGECEVECLTLKHNE